MRLENLPLYGKLLLMELLGRGVAGKVMYIQLIITTGGSVHTCITHLACQPTCECVRWMREVSGGSPLPLQVIHKTGLLKRSPTQGVRREDWVPGLILTSAVNL